MTHQPPLLDGRYRIERKLGQGGFGVTYLARDTRRPGHPLCVAKELLSKHHKNSKIIQLFDQEAEMLERLGRHDQIPKLLAAFPEQDRLYLVLEYIDGMTLFDELHPVGGAKRRLRESAVMAILRDVLGVLAFVHGHQVVHRDIKPANLMRRKDDGKLMLIDFGAVKELTNSQINAQGKITSTVAISSPGYSPDEQVHQGNPRPASDIYALGMTAIEALTGVYPTEMVKSPDTFEWVWRDRCRVSDGLSEYLAQMVQPHFSRRFRDAEVALKALEGVTVRRQAPRVPVAPPVTQPANPPVAQPVKRNPSVPRPPVNQPVNRRVAQPVPAPMVASDPGLLGRPRRDVLKFLGYSVAGVAVTLTGRQLLRGTPEDGSLGSSAVESGLTPQEESPVLESATEAAGQALTAWDLETVQVDGQGEIVARPAVRVQYFDEPYLLGKLGEGLPLRMVQIPAGDFVMGSPADELGRWDREGPQRRVQVPGFFMGAFAVTQGQYAEVMGTNPSKFSGGGTDRPVEQVSWVDAVAFCEKLSELTGNAYRLPSQAEWEYACRAGTTTPFAFGDTLTTDIANYHGNYTYGGGPKGEWRETIVAVNAFSPNGFGLYNVHGNVWEWCADDYLGSYNGAPEDGSPWLSGYAEARKVLRGGSWSSDPRYCRSANLRNLTRARRFHTVGFRVVCVLSP